MVRPGSVCKRTFVALQPVVFIMNLKTLPTRLARFGFSDTPPTLTAGTDTASADWKSECMAWFLVKTETEQGIKRWVTEHKKRRPDYTRDILGRINRLRRLIKQKEHQHDAK